MKVSSPEWIRQFKNLLQGGLFPVVESEVGPLSQQARLLVAVLSIEPLAKWLKRPPTTGRPPLDRQCLASAYFAKAIYNLTTTSRLRERLQSDRPLRRLCGWDSAEQVPSEATFSRAFSEFAAYKLPDKIHEALVRHSQQGRVIDYLARDSTAIEARQHLPGDSDQRPLAAKAVKSTAKGRKKARPGGRHPRSKACERGSRLQRQQLMKLPQMLAELPRACSLGVKTSSQGHQQYWRGFKLHWDVADSGRIPISCILTGASVHDSQVAIPLMQMSAERVRWRCDVMDSAYDAKLIRAHSAKLGHEALIKPNKGHHAAGVSPRELSAEDKQRFKKRTLVEQLNGRLKDEFGGRVIYLRGATKIMAHLLFGIVALTVDQLLRLSG
jgi:hypothetical protein